MATNFSSGNIQFEVGFGPAKASARKPEAYFNLALLGDFSGRASQGRIESLAQRRVWRIDCDSLPKITAQLNACLRLPALDQTGQPFELRFGHLDDFHPDRLLSRVAPLAALLVQRQRLLNSATAPAAVAELQSLLARHSTPPLASTSAVPTTPESDAETMARLLGGQPTPAPAAKAAPGQAGIERLLRESVGTSAVASTTPQQTALLSAVELELTAQLRGLLHNPDFQALEAVWRGLDLLVRDFGAEEDLRLWLVDVSKEELAADLQRQDSLASSGTWNLLQKQADEQPWNLWLGLYTFGNDLADVNLLGCLVRIAAQAGAPFIANASSRLVGCESFGSQPDPRNWNQPMPVGFREAWQALRGLPGAAHAGLALPRFLLRQPYGRRGEAIDAFAFEELSAPSSHEAFLWGNPAILCGHLVASAFQAEGWGLQDCGGEVGALPVHTFEEDGEQVAKPCAEAWLGERGCDAILRQGLIPVLSIKGRDAVRIPALQSLAGSPISFG